MMLGEKAKSGMQLYEEFTRPKESDGEDESPRKRARRNVNV